jgi:hypothetical protein
LEPAVVEHPVYRDPIHWWQILELPSREQSAHTGKHSTEGDRRQAMQGMGATDRSIASRE